LGRTFSILRGSLGTGLIRRSGVRDRLGNRRRRRLRVHRAVVRFRRQRCLRFHQKNSTCNEKYREKPFPLPEFHNPLLSSMISPI
jgi:hypothetical protein